MAASVMVAHPLSDNDFKSVAETSTGPAGHPLPTVRLPTHTSPSHEQMILGIASPLTPAIEEFRGIPYAIVPGRWEHSLLRHSLPQDLFDACHHGPKCPQPASPNNSAIYQSHLDFPDVGESELHCVNLFIVRPSPAALLQAGYDPGQIKLPVYFYIHGGGFGFGAGTDPIWDPTRLVLHSLALKKPFIAVCLNYRLNIFGFAASSSIIAAQEDGSKLKGCNFGIHDQKVALQWVSQNISSFGGDPQNIVLGGQSAGGCSVHTHLLEARSSTKPALFRRAIIQSGAFTSVGIGPVPLENCDKHWNALCEYFAITNQSDRQCLELLRRMPVEDMIKACGDLDWKIFFLARDNLTIKALSETEWALDLSQDGEEEKTRERLYTEPIKVLIGDTDAEGSVFIANALPKLQDYQQIEALFRDAYSSTSDAMKILQAYGIGTKSSVPVLHQGLIDFVTDVTFGYSVDMAYREMSKSQQDARASFHRGECPVKNTTEVKRYRVKFGNPFADSKNQEAHHCVDLIYLFDAFHDALDARDHQRLASFVEAPNSALRHEMQSDWVKFIVGDNMDMEEETVVVYGKDRLGQKVKMRDDAEWVEHRRKLDLIGQHRHEAGIVMQRLFKLAAS